MEKYNKNLKLNIQIILKLNALKSKVSNLDKSNSAILFVLLFKDTTGKYFTYKQSFEEIKVSKSSSYLWSLGFYLNSGMVGGLLTSAIAQGQTISKWH